MLSVFFAFVGVSWEGGGPPREGGFQFGFDGAGGDFVVSEDEDFPVGVVVVSLGAQPNIPVLGESGTGKLQEIFSLLGDRDLVESEEGILQGQAGFGQFLLQAQKLQGGVLLVRGLVVLGQEAVLGEADFGAFAGMATSVLLGVVGLRALDGEDVGLAQLEVGVLGKHRLLALPDAGEESFALDVLASFSLVVGTAFGASC